jgi:cytochrome c5
MVSNGAQVDAKDMPVLIDYLVKNFGTGKPAAAQAPAGGAANDGAAKKLLEESCTACHDLDLVAGQHLSKDEWQQVVGSMVAKGASIENKDVPVLVDYLTKTYGPKK